MGRSGRLRESTTTPVTVGHALLSIPNDSGYFGERLSAAHTQLVQAWKDRSSGLEDQFRQTDILGALLVASQLFAQQPGASKKMLVIYSDMRNSAPHFDLESTPALLSRHYVDQPQTASLSLRGIAIYVRGVDAFDKSIEYWLALREFWREYFMADGATLVDYSAFREAVPIMP